MSAADRTDVAAARSGRAEALARDAITRIAGRMHILASATGRPFPAGAPISGPMAALARLIARRCDQDAELRARIHGTLDQYAEARQLLYTHSASASPEALEAIVGPLLELHEVFASDPVLGRLFGPEAGRTPAAARTAAPLPGQTAPPGATGSLLLATIAPDGPRRLIPQRRPAMPARLGTNVEVDLTLLRAARGVAVAEATLEAHRKRIALLEAAVEFASSGRSAALTLAAPPVQAIIKQIAKIAQNPDLAERMTAAILAFHSAERDIIEAARTIDRARGMPPREARDAIVGVATPERIGQIVEPLADLPDEFRTHPVLARMFPPLAV